MAFLIGAGTVVFFAVILLVVGVALERKAKSFNENVRSGKAEVVGYDRTNQSDWYTLLVRIPELNDGKIYNCTAGKINLSQYPKGAIIDVLYAPKTIVGIKIVEVHLCDNPPADSFRLGRGIKRFSLALLVLTAILIVVGLITVIY